MIISEIKIQQDINKYFPPTMFASEYNKKWEDDGHDFASKNKISDAIDLAIESNYLVLKNMPGRRKPVLALNGPYSDSHKYIKVKGNFSKQ
jgi:hypothetical protein